MLALSIRQTVGDASTLPAPATGLVSASMPIAAPRVGGGGRLGAVVAPGGGELGNGGGGATGGSGPGAARQPWVLLQKLYWARRYTLRQQPSPEQARQSRLSLAGGCAGGGSVTFHAEQSPPLLATLQQQRLPQGRRRPWLLQSFTNAPLRCVLSSHEAEEGLRPTKMSPESRALTY